jgi:hypothetical protein
MRIPKRAALAAATFMAWCAAAHAQQQVTGNAFNPAISVIMNGH